MSCYNLVEIFKYMFLHRSNKYTANVPALLLARHKEGQVESIPLTDTHAQEMVRIITNALLETFVSIFYNKDVI